MEPRENESTHGHWVVEQHVKKGDELGYFAFGGSTCLVIFKQGTIAFDNDLMINSAKPIETLVKVGQQLGVKI